MGQFRRLIIFLHRYLGIPMSVVFVVWFVSGVVMMYAGGMPTLTAEERLNRLPALDLSAVRVSPATAAETAGVRGFVWDAELTTVLERPAYRFGQGGITVFADTGDILDTTSREQARRAASQFLRLPQASLEFAGTVSEPDQWTLIHRADLPLDRFVADDGAASWVYVSQYSGEVVLVTDRQTRLLAWLGTIPHWFYFTPLRLNQPLWYWTVVWTAALGCVLAVLGLILGVIQFRRSKPFDLNKSIRYRGWMRWHYYTGILFGLFALTWVFSGLMSMEPFAWTTARGLEIPGDALQGGVPHAGRLPDNRRRTLAASSLGGGPQGDRIPAHSRQSLPPRALHARTPAGRARASESALFGRARRRTRFRARRCAYIPSARGAGRGRGDCRAAAQCRARRRHHGP